MIPPRAQGALLAAAIMLVLGPSLGAGFVWDDYRLIVESPTLNNLQNIPGYFSANLAKSSGAVGVSAEGVDVYRPLYMTMLALVRTLTDQPDSRLFHLSVLLWHLGCCLLLWRVARRVLQGSVPPVLVTLAFAFHPVTSEAYLLASSICEPMAACGLLGAALLLDGIDESKRRPARVRAALAGGVLLCGLLSKEVILFALPPVFVWLVSRGLRWPRLVPSLLAAGLFLVMRIGVLGGLAATGSGPAQRLDFLHHTPLLLVEGFWAGLAMRPLGIRHLSYEYEVVPWSVAALAGLVVLAAVVVAALRRRDAPEATLAVFVFVLMLLPVGMVTTVHGWGGFGRYLYVPWAFGALALGTLFSGPVRRTSGWSRGLVVLGLMAYLVLQQLGLRTALADWSDQERVARSGIRQAPEVGVHYSWLADVLRDRGQRNQAQAYFEEAIVKTEHYDPAHVHLAELHRGNGQPEVCLTSLERLEARKGPGPKSSLLATLCLLDLGRYEQAARRLLWALHRAPENDDLTRLQGELLAIHPRPEEYQRWLKGQLVLPEYAAAAPVVLRLLDAAQGSGDSG
ncbi:MAG TPA: hypothetical protein DIU15_06750 [Deltaproteobacteria bacterium]|nr:hypothetical protein [Deltaproteobacteria bacterium]HCP45721.1 hypothetical protein [Deltaproteobacteria bacterium]